MTFKGQGPLGELQAIATSEGQVKGRVQVPLADPPLNAAGKLNVGAAVGKGFLAVVRNHPLMAQPYTGDRAPAWRWCDDERQVAAYVGQSCRLGVTPRAVLQDGDVITASSHTIAAGMVPIHSGEIAEDLAQYLADSEQQNCALGLGVSIGREAEVLSAGGFLLQVSRCFPCGSSH